MSKTVSRELLFLAATAALDNGRELVADAALLLAAHRAPRAMALAILALEELSKALLIWIWLRAEKRTKVPELTILQKGLRDHKIKLLMHNMFARALKVSTEGITLDEQTEQLRLYVAEAERHAKTSDTIKQHSFYVHVSSKKVTKPSESITEDHAASTLRLAKSWLAVLEMFERSLEQDGVAATRL